MPVVNADGDIKGDIIVWEDSPVSARSSSPSPESHVDTSIKAAVEDENSVHPGDEVV